MTSRDLAICNVASVVSQSAIGLAVLLLAAAGCTTGSQEAPALMGPSTFGVAVTLTASPDLLSRNGSAQSTITILAMDPGAQPMKGLGFRVDVSVNGQLGDLGTLSARTVYTGNDGRALVTYTAPPAVAPGQTNEATIQVIATRISNDASTTFPSGVSIRLVSTGVIQPPNGAPTSSFFVSPTSPHEGDSVLFDGSASKDTDGSIVSYKWNFGDGATAATTSTTTTHAYSAAGTYQATLAVTDDKGLTTTSTAVSVTVAATTNPVGSFVVSPSALHVGEAANFNASASTAAAGHSIVSYSWDFGDGTSATTDGPTTTKSYLVARTYTVVLTVIDDTGHRGTVTQTVTIQP